MAVGDATATNSVDKITAEPGTANSTVIINNFQATSSVLFQTMTKTVTISDGFLTLSAVGGTNSKIDYVDAVPVAGAATDTTDPSATISLAGTLTSGTTYFGPVSASAVASDDVGGSGIASVTYSVDGGAATLVRRCCADFSTAGPHSFAVTAKDVAGNTFTTSVNFTVVLDTTKPTLTVTLGGTLNAAATAYVGDVTADVVADDLGGSGLASTRYVLDADASAPVSGTITISAVGDHTLTVTATDGAGNVTTVVKTFTIVAAPRRQHRADRLARPQRHHERRRLPRGRHGHVRPLLTRRRLRPRCPHLRRSTARPRILTPHRLSCPRGGHHTMTVTAYDGAGNTPVRARAGTPQLVDTTPPTRVHHPGGLPLHREHLRR